MTTLFDLMRRAHETPQQARESALEQVREHAHEPWFEEALAVVRALDHGDLFTSDLVWHSLPLTVTTHEPRAMGALLRHASRLGLIRPTAQYRPSTRVACHARPVRVWERLASSGGRA
jgi:hypothetical protein